MRRLNLTPDIAPAADAARPARIAPWLCALAAVVLLCVAPSTASAGTLTLRWVPEGDDAEYDVPGMTFRASGGERNRLVVRGGDRRIEIRDVHPIRLVVRERPRGLRLPSCRRLAAGRLRCAAPADEADGDVYLGDMDDRLVASGAMFFSVSGGDGDDVIRAGQASGGSGRDVLTGGPRADYLSGGPGRDRVRGGGGHDTVCGDCEGSSGAWSDVVEGGDGVDEVALSGGRIRVDLSRPDRDGDVRAPDVLRGVETIRVWSREDALLSATTIRTR